MTNFYSFTLPRHLDTAVRTAKMPSETQLLLAKNSLDAGATVLFTGRFTQEDGADAPHIRVVIDYTVDLLDGRMLISAMAPTDDGAVRCFFDLAELYSVESGGLMKPTIKPLSQVRRELKKADRELPKDLFTPGTRCIVKVAFSEEKEITVKYLVQNGPDSFCIETGVKHESQYMQDSTYAYNIAHVIEVLEHVPGKLEVRYPRRELMDKYSSDAPGFRMPGRYHNWDRDSMIRQAIGSRVPPAGTVLLLDRLCELVDARGVFRAEQTEGYFRVFSANKKRLKRVVAQLYNRALMSAAVAQDQEDEMMNEAMSDMWDSRDDDEGYPDATRGDRRDQQETCDDYNAMDYDCSYD